MAGELGRLEKKLFEADWAEARERLGATRWSPSFHAPQTNAGPTPSSRWPLVDLVGLDRTSRTEAAMSLDAKEPRRLAVERAARLVAREMDHS